MKINHKPRNAEVDTLRSVLVILAAAGASLLLQLGYRGYRAGIPRSVLDDAALWMVALAGLGLAFVGYWSAGRFRPGLEAKGSSGLRAAVWFGYGALAITFPTMVLAGVLNGMPLLFLRVVIFGWICLAAALLLRWSLPRYSLGQTLMATVLGFGMAYRVSLFIPNISSYIFSMAWSEASRYYYGSLFFATSLYGVDAAPSVLHPTRYLLQSIPFLLPQLGLIAHRAWQVALWLGMPLVTLLLLIRRLALDKRWTAGLALIWGFLFLFQGPILYHLYGSVIPVLWGFDRRKPWRSLLVVMIGSLWAGISRVNWFPVPGMLAAALYFLEAPRDDDESPRILIWPGVFFIVGIATAFAAQAGYVLWSGNDPGQFSSSFSSSLLWYRLLPNPTFRIGVLGGIGLASGPAAMSVLRLVRRGRFALHQLAIVGILLVLLAGGTVVSVKIGGGSNLHNFDAFLMLLLVVILYLLLERTPLARAGARPTLWERAALIAIPVGFALSLGGPMPERDRTQADAVLGEIRGALERAPGEHLFIAERHLITFNHVDGVRLIPEYEKVFLMEMAMSENQAYLGALARDLENRRFSIIVSDPLRIQFQGRARAFGEENDAWVRHVSVPVLCHYAAVYESEDPPVQILIPRGQDDACEQ